ncbi:MAG: alpha/beta hydrolase [Kiloniellales bacterium]
MSEEPAPLEAGIARYAATLRDAMQGKPLPTSPEERRRVFALRATRFRLPIPEGVEIVDHHICAPGREIPFRLYRPKTAAPPPLVLYLHGGGWVCGDVSTHESVTAPLAAGSGVAVASLHYRRAPENPFPAAFEDASFALRWLIRQAGAFGLDAGRIAVAGDSAGGNLAAALAIEAREQGDVALKAQILLYPVVDDDVERPSYRADRDPFLTRAGMIYYLESYFAQGHGRDDPLGLPLRCRNLGGLPPAYILAADNDPLRDEALDYAARLEAAGVPTTLRLVPGTIHGFLRAQPVSALARAEMALLGNVTRALLA